MNIAKIEEQAPLDYVKEITRLTEEQLITYSEDAFNLYWFMRINSLTSLILTSDDVNKLHSCGMFKTVALMYSIQHVTPTDLQQLQFNQTPVDLALHRILSLPNCKSDLKDLKVDVATRNTYWFSIQFGVYSVNLPSYMWNYAVDAVQQITHRHDFETRIQSINGIQVIQLAFGLYNFSEVAHDILEIPLNNEIDPVKIYTEDFTALGLYAKKRDFLEEVSVLFPLLHLIDLNKEWRLVLTSLLQKRIVWAYDPEDTVWDAILKVLMEDAHGNVQVPKMTDNNGRVHVKGRTVFVNDESVDLRTYALHPEQVTI